MRRLSLGGLVDVGVDDEGVVLEVFFVFGIVALLSVSFPLDELALEAEPFVDRFDLFVAVLVALGVVVAVVDA